MRWYVVHTRPNAETRAAWHLLNQGFADVYLPCYRKRRRHARRVDWTRAPIFPRYLFVRLDIETIRWRSILSTIGVSDILRNEDRPIPLPEGIVEALRAREGGDGTHLIDANDGLRKGEPVKILLGSLAGKNGLFERGDEGNRVIVLIDMLGRYVRMSVGAEAVTRAA